MRSRSAFAGVIIFLLVFVGSTRRGGGGMGYQQRAGGRILRVVRNEAFCFGRVVGCEVVRPAEADGLVPEFGFDLERALRVAGSNRILDQASSGGEVGIVGGFSDNGDI